MIGMLGFGVYIDNLVPDGPTKGVLIANHKAFGVLILIFGLWRVSSRLQHGFLDDASAVSKWQLVKVRTVHWILLLSVIAMPLGGMMGSYFGGHATSVFGLFTIPGAAQAFFGMHSTLAMITIAAVVLHICGALKHHFLDKDDTLKRMLGRT